MLKLAPTSALVLQFLGVDFYQKSLSREYLSRLDLSQGDGLYDKCFSVWSHYGEILRNRKFSILDFLRQCVLSREDSEIQVVITAAGVDALGMEIISEFSNVSVWELDRDGMNVKSDILKSMGQSTDRLSFLEVNLLDEELVYERLVSSGWRADLPTILVVEGISYYLPSSVFKTLFRKISPEWGIFEYLRHYDDISPSTVTIPERVFSILTDVFNLDNVYRYNSSEVEALSEMTLDICHDMSQSEKLRTGTNTYFFNENDGWIDICLLRKASVS